MIFIEIFYSKYPHLHRLTLANFTANLLHSNYLNNEWNLMKVGSFLLTRNQRTWEFEIEKNRCEQTSERNKRKYWWFVKTDPCVFVFDYDDEIKFWWLPSLFLPQTLLFHCSSYGGSSLQRCQCVLTHVVGKTFEQWQNKNPKSEENRKKKIKDTWLKYIKLRRFIDLLFNI